MECRLVELAISAKQCKLDNGNKPTPPTLSEAETADVDSFLVDILSIYPLLGLRVFEKLESHVSPQELLHIESKGIKASGYEDAKGFVVCEGSQLAKEEVPSIHRYMSTLRNDLLEQGVISPQGACFVFAQDQVFNSPSTAAGFVLGRTANGRIEWKNKDGSTLKQLQTAAASQRNEAAKLSAAV